MTIDQAYLALQTGGDEALQHELLGLFLVQLEEARGLVETISDCDATIELLHKLKGSSRAIGATALGDSIEQIERRIGSSRDFKTVRGELKGLRNPLRDAAVSVTSLIDARVLPGLAKRHENG